MFKPGNEWMIEEFQAGVDKAWEKLLLKEEITNLRNDISDITIKYSVYPYDFCASAIVWEYFIILLLYPFGIFIVSKLLYPISFNVSTSHFILYLSLSSVIR